MPVEQAGTNPPETQSYDAEMMADVRSAFTETTTKAAETVTETPAESAPEVKAEPEAKVEAAPLTSQSSRGPIIRPTRRAMRMARSSQRRGTREGVNP
jgi:hypothetical protein